MSIGPHLLGRIHRPDERDWTLAQLDEHLAAFTAATTLQQLIDAGAVWRDILALWHWIKAQEHGVAPTPPPAPSGAVLWADPIVLDQGKAGTCVGNGWAGQFNCAPTYGNYTETDARAIYEAATTIDNGKPDTTYQLGTTVRSGAKVMQTRGRIAAYAFAKDLGEVIAFLTRGAVVPGTDWDNPMFKPDAKNFVHPDGNVAGGHCYLLKGYDPSAKVFTFQNSWGLGWGDGGSFYMTAADFEALCFGRSTGEVCLALELPK